MWPSATKDAGCNIASTDGLYIVKVEAKRRVMRDRVFLKKARGLGWGTKSPQTPRDSFRCASAGGACDHFLSFFGLVIVVFLLSRMPRMGIRRSRLLHHSTSMSRYPSKYQSTSNVDARRVTHVSQMMHGQQWLTSLRFDASSSI